MPPAFGYKGPDEDDSRDRPFAALKGALEAAEPPEEYSLKKFVASVLDQGAIGSCVIHAFAQGVRLCQLRNETHDFEIDNPPELMSRLFGYYNSRVQHGDEGNDSGTYIRLTIKMANKLGRPPESVWPYDLSDLGKQNAKWKQRPKLEAYQHAADHKPADYNRIYETDNERVNAIKRSIAFEENPVVFGTLVSFPFLDVDDDSLIHVPNGLPTAGGHAMLIVGYDKEGPWVVNSWGTGWGVDGFGHLSWDYLKWQSTRDLWSINV